MILPYYKIKKTEEGKQFFYTHEGYFNFWNEYLIMNIKEGENKAFTVLINRTGRKFNYTQSHNDSYKTTITSYVEESIQQRKPEEMFDDFPELNRLTI